MHKFRKTHTIINNSFYMKYSNHLFHHKTMKHFAKHIEQNNFSVVFGHWLLSGQSKSIAFQKVVIPCELFC